MSVWDGAAVRPWFKVIVILQTAILWMIWSHDGGFLPGTDSNRNGAVEVYKMPGPRTDDVDGDSNWLDKLASMKKEREKKTSLSLFSPICKDVDETLWVGDTVIWKNSECGQYEIRRRNVWDHRILIIGDSLARRFAITLAALLAGGRSSENLGGDMMVHSTIKNISAQNIDFMWDVCLGNMSNTTKMYANRYDVIVLSASIHYIDGDCMDRSFEKDFDDFLLPILETCRDKIWWRLEPLSGRDFATHRAIEIYQHVKQYRHKISLIDHFKLLLPRSTGSDRIAGNTPEHFGVSARLAMAQHFLKIAPSLFFTNKPSGKGTP